MNLEVIKPQQHFYRAWKLKRPLNFESCHDDATVLDLSGHFLISNGQTIWVKGVVKLPLKVSDNYRRITS